MSAFTEQFPNQYETYMWNNRDKEMTVYKGSIYYHKTIMLIPRQRLQICPALSGKTCAGLSVQRTNIMKPRPYLRPQ